jgi:hypothetical protein
MKNILIIILIISVSHINTQGQLFQNIRGRVIDKGTGVPLTGATVILLNSEPVKGTICDENGKFKIENVNIGRQGVKVSFLGYYDKTIGGIMVSSGKETVLEIELEEKLLTLNEVTIKGNISKDEVLNDMALISSRSFTIEETERFAGSMGDPARMVANYAGVMTQNDTRNDIIIRGNSPMGVLWRLDGIEVPNPNHFGALGTTGGPVSMINNNLLTNSDFLTGSFPAEFGNTTSGVFDLHLRNGNNEKHEFIGQIGFNGFEFGAEGPFIKNKDASYIINYRYSTLAVVNYLGIDLGTGTAIPFYQDLTMKINLPFKKYGRFSFILIKGKSNIFLKDDTTDSDVNAYNNIYSQTKYSADLGVAGLTHLYMINSKTYIKSTISIQKTNNFSSVDKIQYSSDENIIPYYRSKYSENKYSVSSYIKSKLNNKNTIQYGIIADIYDDNFEDSVNIENDKFIILINQKGKTSLLRSYAQWQNKINENLQLTGGIHFMYFFLNNKYTIEPRLAATWQFSDNQTFKIGYGLHSQLHPRMIYFEQTVDTITNIISLQNKKLDFTKSHHIVLGYDIKIKNNVRVRAEIYGQKLFNIPVSEEIKQFSICNFGDFFSMPHIQKLVNKGKGYNYGLEITVEKFLTKGYYFLFTGSFFDSKYCGYDGIYRNTAFNGKYVINTLGGYEIKINNKNFITFDIKGVWAGGHRYIPFSDEIYNRIKLGKPSENNILPELKEITYNWDKAYEQKYNDYFRIDFRIGFKMNLRKFNQEWAIDLKNITNYKSIFSQQYDKETNQIVTTYQQGFMPMMLWRIQF